MCSKRRSPFHPCVFSCLSVWRCAFVSLQASSPVFVPETSHELLHRMTGKGLSAQYRFTRQPCIYGNNMVSLQLTLSNSSDQALENIHISERSSTGQDIHRFNTIGERVNKARASECVMKAEHFLALLELESFGCRCLLSGSVDR